MTAAATSIKKVTLELGGKSPNIVFADADLEQAVRGAYWGIFFNTGQACQAGSRLLVQREVHDEFVAALREMTMTSRVGDPLEESTMIGPLVDQNQLETVTDYIERGTQEGAQLVCGGSRPQGPQSRPDTSSSPPFSTGSPRTWRSDARRSSGRCCRY